MTKTQQHLKDYISDITKGIVTINKVQADKITDIVIKGGNKTAFVKLSRWNGAKQTYEFVRTIETTEEAIKAEVIAALKKPLVEFCYRFDCFNSNEEFEGKIFTVNPALF